MTAAERAVTAVAGDAAWLSTPQVAAVLDVSKMTVCRMIQSGQLGASRLRPRSPFRIPRSEVVRVIISARQGLDPTGAPAPPSVTPDGGDRSHTTERDHLTGCTLRPPSGPADPP